MILRESEKLMLDWLRFSATQNRYFLKMFTFNYNQFYSCYAIESDTSTTFIIRWWLERSGFVLQSNSLQKIECYLEAVIGDGFELSARARAYVYLLALEMSHATSTSNECIQLFTALLSSSHTHTHTHRDAFFE